MDTHTVEETETEAAISHEGGEVHTVGNNQRLMRFLITGTGGGTVYATGGELLKENAQIVLDCLTEKPDETIITIMMVSNKGLAVSNEPCLMALAMAVVLPEDAKTRRAGWSAFPLVCRTGTHLFHFLSYCKALNNGRYRVNRGSRVAIAGWYEARRGKVESEAWMPLLHDVLKYKGRDNVSHRDILKVFHPLTDDKVLNAIYYYIMHDSLPSDTPKYLSDYINDYRRVQGTLFVGVGMDVPMIIEDRRFPREMVADRYLSDVEVWKALSAHMPITAMIRNLPKMTALKLFDDKAWLDVACDRLTDKDVLSGGRVHPIALLLALRAYQTNTNKNLNWTAHPYIVAALEDAVRLSYGNVIPTGKRIRLCIDTSGSMTHTLPNGLTPREIGAMMALITHHTEPNAEIVGFSSTLQKDLAITRNTSLTDMVNTILRSDAFHTYCRLPIVDATENDQDFDAFIFYTDSETADGNMLRQHNKDEFHPFSHYLSEYREKRVADARIVVAATAATKFTLNDPDDPLGLDIAGFSADVPLMISAFIRAGEPLYEKDKHDAQAAPVDAPVPSAV